MMFLNTKIPPPIVTILFAIMIFYFSDNFAYVDLPFKIYISVFFIILGFIVTFSSARNFKKKDTTVNPMKPNDIKNSEIYILKGKSIYAKLSEK